MKRAITNPEALLLDESADTGITTAFDEHVDTKPVIVDTDNAGLESKPTAVELELEAYYPEAPNRADLEPPLDWTG